MDRGRIEAWGTHDELLETCKVYREIHQSVLGEEDDGND